MCKAACLGLRQRLHVKFASCVYRSAAPTCMQLSDPLHALYETTTKDTVLKVRYGLFDEMHLFGTGQCHGMMDECFSVNERGCE